MGCQPGHYHVLIYRMPSRTTAASVRVWRDLKRLGALSLQHGVYILPSAAARAADLGRVARRIADAGGTYHLVPLRSLPPKGEAKIIAGFIAQSTLQYEEIIETCQASVIAKIACETCRQTYTDAAARELRHDLDKLRRWYDRVVARDWFGAARRAEAVGWIEQGAALLAQFEEMVRARGGWPHTD